MVEKVKNIFFIRFPAAYNQIKTSHACLGRHSIIAINNSGKIENLLDVRLDACAVGWFLLSVISMPSMTSLKIKLSLKFTLFFAR